MDLLTSSGHLLTVKELWSKFAATLRSNPHTVHTSFNEGLLEQNFKSLETTKLHLPQLTPTRYVSNLIICKEGLLSPPDVFLTYFDDLVIPPDTGIVLDVDTRLLLIQHIYTCLIYTINPNKIDGRTEVTLIPYLLPLVTIFLTKELPKVAICMQEQSIIDQFSLHEPTLKLREAQWKSYINTEGLKPLRDACQQFCCCCTILMFRKQAFYKQSVGLYTDGFVQVDKSNNEDMYELPNRLYVKFLPVILANVDKWSITNQYMFEYQTLDCLMTYCMYRGLHDSTIVKFARQYSTILDSLILTDVEYHYPNGSIKFAYTLCVSYLVWATETMADFTFNFEHKCPPRLSQFESTRLAVSTLLSSLPLDALPETRLDSLGALLRELFQSIDILLQKYHEGHPKFTTLGPSIKDMWPTVPRILATLGKAVIIASKTNKNLSIIVTDKLDWVEKPLFKYEPVQTSQVLQLAKAIAVVYTTSNPNLQREMRMAICTIGEQEARITGTIKAERLR